VTMLVMPADQFTHTQRCIILLPVSLATPWPSQKLQPMYAPKEVGIGTNHGDQKRAKSDNDRPRASATSMLHPCLHRLGLGLVHQLELKIAGLGKQCMHPKKSESEQITGIKKEQRVSRFLRPPADASDGPFSQPGYLEFQWSPEALNPLLGPDNDRPRASATSMLHRKEACKDRRELGRVALNASSARTEPRRGGAVLSTSRQPRDRSAGWLRRRGVQVERLTVTGVAALGEFRADLERQKGLRQGA
jgi:hypothetical protein